MLDVIIDRLNHLENRIEQLENASPSLSPPVDDQILKSDADGMFDYLFAADLPRSTHHFIQSLWYFKEERGFLTDKQYQALLRNYNKFYYGIEFSTSRNRSEHYYG